MNGSNGVTATAGRPPANATHAQDGASKKSAIDPLAGSPDLETDCMGEMGIEGLAAALSLQSAQANAKLLHELSRQEKQEQIDALNRQVDELHDKASAIRTEGWVSGAAIAAGGVATMAGGFSSARTGDAADGVARFGQSFGQVGSNVAKATSGAAQVDHDANATRDAADAKFHEQAKDDYDAIARDAKGVVDRVQQTLQGIQQERVATRRAILRNA